MQFFDSCSGFGDLVFVSMLHSVIIDLNVVVMPNLFPILSNFSVMPTTYSITSVLLGFSSGV